MEIINDMDRKVEIEYPCEWKYKVIGEGCEAIEKAVKEVMGEREHTCRPSRVSREGKYHSYEVKTLVHNDDDRTELFHRLKKHDDLKMVL
ncbi:HP0495 family protein [Hydrogenimonas sp.]